VVRARHS